MVGQRKRQVSAKRSRRTSQSVSEQMIGSHVARGSHSRRGPQNASSVAFSNTRATNRATKGEVNTITPTTASGESVSAYRQRARQIHYIETIQRRARRKRIVVFVVVLAFIIALAATAGYLAFRSTVGGGMALKDSDAATVLVAPKEADEATYTLITADIGAVAKPLERSGPDVFILARLDAKDATATLINIPADLRVTLSDGATHRLYEAADMGDAAVISAVAKFAGVTVNHYVKLDEEGLVGLVDMLGGIQIDVDQVIDDPRAGSAYIAPGEQTLAGEALLTYLRATNVKLGVLDQMTHQLEFTRSLLAVLFADGGAASFASRLDDAGAYFQTDCSFDDIAKAQEWLKDIPAKSYTMVTTPGYTEATTGVVEGEVAYYIASSSEFAQIIEQIEQGENPNASEHAIAELDKGSFTVAIQNGYNIAGAAASTAEVLKAAGFNVGEVGNAEQPVYEETLVIYKSGPEGPTRAQAVIEALGFGRAVYASYYYEFEGDVLVIIGADYMPTS